MSIHAKFDNPKPVALAGTPIVLRFAGLHPNDLGRFTMHDTRRGGDLSHVDLDATPRNEMLFGAADWKKTLRAEVDEAKRHNLREQIAALEAKSRKNESRKVREQGPVDPWRHSRHGPLREGILTVNKAWFGGSGHEAWDPERVAAFRTAALAFLKQNFPEGQLRYASGHGDEEAYHIHFVLAVWCERVTANRGRQVMLQASMNALLKDYEHAQDLAGEAFAHLGITRGERSAEARRAARAAGAEIPKKRRHIPPSKWRASQQAAGHEKAIEIINAAQSKAEAIVDQGRAAGEVAVRKSRKRAIKEARQRKEAATRAAAVAERHRKKEEQAAEAARRERNNAEATLGSIEEKAANIVNAAQAEAATLRQVEEQRRAEEEVLARTAERRKAEEARLDSSRAKADAAETRAADVERVVDAVEAGIGLIANGALCWSDDAGDEPRLTWGRGAPEDAADRQQLLQRVRPAGSLIRRIAKLVARTVRRVLAAERRQLAKDAAFVAGLRADWEAEQQAKLDQLRGNSGPDSG